MTMHPGVLLETRGVTRRFGGRPAVDRVDLEVRPGMVVGLLGANGAGKTTLIRLALGLLPPEAGTVTLLGRPPSAAGRARIGYMPQGLGLYDDLTVAENLQFVSAAYGVTAPPLEPDLAPLANATIGSVSLGVRRRVAFAAALGHAPELLLLDEPTSGVDPLGRARLWDTIRGAAETGVGILVTTHAMNEAEQCDRLVVLANGRVVADAPPAELTTGRTAVEVSCEVWESAFNALDRAGIPVALAGRRLRVAGADRVHIASVLAGAGVTATQRIVPATLEEAFMTLAAA